MIKLDKVVVSFLIFFCFGVLAVIRIPKDNANLTKISKIFTHNKKQKQNKNIQNVGRISKASEINIIVKSDIQCKLLRRMPCTLLQIQKLNVANNVIIDLNLHCRPRKLIDRVFHVFIVVSLTSIYLHVGSQVLNFIFYIHKEFI